MDDPTTSGTTEGFGLMFYNARWYDPSLGRFAQADTIVPGGVQGLDRYAYANNSPLIYIDPSGHSVDCGLGELYCKAGKYAPPQPPLLNDVPLSPQAQDLVDFAKSIKVTPEYIIAIALGHEMKGWDVEDLELAKQHIYNRFVYWARSNCGGYLTNNCMLNFFMKQYQSVQNMVYESSDYGRAHRVPSKFWFKPELFERQNNSWLCLGVSCTERGNDVMNNFWNKINPFYNPDDNPGERDLPFDSGVYLVSDLTAALGHPPRIGDGILAMIPGTCNDGDGFSVIVSFVGFRTLNSKKVCDVGK